MLHRVLPVVWGLLLSVSPAQTTWFVSASALPPFLGSSAFPFRNVQDGINAASNGDTVQVQPGNYIEQVNYFGKAIRVLGQLGAFSTTIDGGGVRTVVVFVTGEGPQSILEGFTITNGGAVSGTIRGGGILCSASSPVIKRCVITGNNGDGGLAGSANQGGGVNCLSGAAPTVSDCTVSSNSGHTSCSSLACLTVFGGGGGINSIGSSPVIRNCRIAANSAGNRAGGGIHCAGGSPLIVNCLIYGNSGGQPGNITSSGPGGIYVSAGVSDSATILNCSLTGNNSNYGVLSSSAAIVVTGGTINSRITNTIAWMNTSGSPSVGEVSAPAGTVSYCDIRGGFAGTGNIDQDPLWVSPGTGDLHLGNGSPAVDAGNNAAPNLPTIDFEGNIRIFNGIVDLGADERIPLNPVPVITALVPGSIAPLSPASPPIYVTIEGNAFVPTSTVWANGTQLAFSFVSLAPPRFLCTLPASVLQTQRPGAICFNVRNGSSTVSNSVPLIVGSGNNQGTIRREPLAPSPGQAYGMEIEGGLPNAVFSVYVDLLNLPPLTQWPDLSTNFVIAVGPPVGSSQFIPILEGIGIFGPGSGTALGSSGTFASGPVFILPNPIYGVPLTVQGVYLNPASAYGFTLTWARYPDIL